MRADHRDINPCFSSCHAAQDTRLHQFRSTRSRTIAPPPHGIVAG